MIWKKLFGSEQPEAAIPDEDCDAILDAAFDWLETSNSELRAGLMQSVDRFDLDLAAGRIAFTKESGEILNLACQAVGSFNEARQTWHWAWDHPTIPAEVAASAELVRAFGARFGLNALVTRQIEANENDAWQFVALAGMLATATGTYRCPTGDVSVFVTLHPLS